MSKREKSEHYKLYKAGELWLTVAIATFTLGMASVASADHNQPAVTKGAVDIMQTAAPASQPAAASSVAASETPGAVKSEVASQESAASNVVSDVKRAAKEGAAAALPVASTKKTVTPESATPKAKLPQVDNDLLSRAENFHIFAKEVKISADVNGNIATAHLISGPEFGTRGQSSNYGEEDIYYIDSLDNLGAKAFRTGNNKAIFGDKAYESLEIKNGQVFVNGIRLDHLKANNVQHIGNFIDFDAEFVKLTNLAATYASHQQTAGVKVDLKDMNNRSIDVSGIDDNVTFVGVPVDIMEAP